MSLKPLGDSDVTISDGNDNSKTWTVSGETEFKIRTDEDRYMPSISWSWTEKAVSGCEEPNRVTTYNQMSLPGDARFTVDFARHDGGTAIVEINDTTVFEQQLSVYLDKYPASTSYTGEANAGDELTIRLKNGSTPNTWDSDGQAAWSVDMTLYPDIDIVPAIEKQP